MHLEERKDKNWLLTGYYFKTLNANFVISIHYLLKLVRLIVGMKDQWKICMLCYGAAMVSWALGRDSHILLTC